MKILNNVIDSYFTDKNVLQEICNKYSTTQLLFPFSLENIKLSYLLSKNIIDFDKYINILSEYHLRNKYLYLFDMAPRTFGQTWGETHIRKLFPEFLQATKENLNTLYPNFDGEFDLWIDGIRVEVKACRANSTNETGALASRAYTHSEAKEKQFKYHYQQLKPSCCDIFIWIGVCKDELIYWVLTSEELQQTNKLGSQHRNENTGTGAAVFEGQVFMTEEELFPFLTPEKDILNKIKEKGNKS